MSRHRSSSSGPWAAVPSPRPALDDALVAGIPRPDLPGARRALERVFGERTAVLWADLTSAAGLRGDEEGAEAVRALVGVLAEDDPVARLCALSLQIRLDAFEALTAADPSGSDR